MKTALYFRNRDGQLSSVTYGKPHYDIDAVQDQCEIKQGIASLGHVVQAKTPVLCLIQMD